MNQQNESILIAGGAGFIGRHLCAKLLQRNAHKVICVDNLSTGSIENIKEFLNNPRFIFLEHDITIRFDMEDDISEIYNFACPASPIQYQKDPIHTFATSVIGSQRLLEMVRKKDARIMLASASEIYGDPLVSPQNESYFGNVNTNGPRSCYDEGKRAAETLFHDYNKVYGVDTQIIRIFNTYGPYMSVEDGRVVPNFIQQALKNIPLTLNGDGKQTRSLQYIDDLISGINCVMKDGIPHTPINLGNPNEMSILELANKIIKLTKSNSTISYQSLPKDDPKQRNPDTTLAKRLLCGWHPLIKIDEGLLKTIEFFRLSI